MLWGHHFVTCVQGSIRRSISAWIKIFYSVKNVTRKNSRRHSSYFSELRGLWVRILLGCVVFLKSFQRVCDDLVMMPISSSPTVCVQPQKIPWNTLPQLAVELWSQRGQAVHYLLSHTLLQAMVLCPCCYCSWALLGAWFIKISEGASNGAAVYMVWYKRAWHTVTNAWQANHQSQNRLRKITILIPSQTIAITINKLQGFPRSHMTGTNKTA